MITTDDARSRGTAAEQRDSKKTFVGMVLASQTGGDERAMEPLFTFMSLNAPSSKADAVPLDADTAFQNDLRRAAAGDQPRTDTAAAASSYVVGDDFVRDPGDVAAGERMITECDRLRREAAESDVVRIRQLVELAGERWAADRDRARDSLLAAYLLPDRGVPDCLESLVRMYALGDAAQHGSLTVEGISRMLAVPITIPAELVGLRDSNDAPASPTPEEQLKVLVQEINDLTEWHGTLRFTLSELAFHDADELVVRNDGVREALSNLYAVTAETSNDVPRLPVSPAALATSRMTRAGAGRNIVFSGEAVDLLADSARQTLRDLDLDPLQMPLMHIHERIFKELEITEQKLREHHLAMRKFNPFEPVGAAPVFAPGHFPPVDDPDPQDLPSQAPDAQLPTTHGTAKPLGVSDLLLVRQHLSHYRRGDVAYVENVLAHDKLTHSRRDTEADERTIVDESEQSDLRAVAQTSAENESGRASIQTVAPGYGPLAGDAAAKTFAQSVTDQVSATVSARTRRVATRRQLRERQETLEHVLDNSTSAQVDRGVYQWLDKVYEARVFRYDQRLLYDIVVPEPAALYRRALGRLGAPVPVRPAPFTSEPEQIEDHNWAYLVAGHGVSGFEPPPPKLMVVTETFFGRAEDIDHESRIANTVLHAEMRSTRLPKGYRAKTYRVRASLSGDKPWISVTVGMRQPSTVKSDYMTGPLYDERDSIPVGVNVTCFDGSAPGAWTFTVGVEIVCERTPDALAAWQAKAHTAILEANRRRFQEYEERLANREAAVRVMLQSLTPEQKRQIVQTEVKRSALSVLTNQDFGGFNAIETDAFAFPHPSLSATDVLSPYIRFFEQAVEWNHVGYGFYPYFWGRKQHWVEKLAVHDPDPSFAGFLTSGAARVVLPIRRGYEPAFEQFMNTGVTPSTDEMLNVGGPLWASLASQLQEQEEPETPVGEPWHYPVTSGLIWARKDGSVPRWRLANGVRNESSDPAF
ncbi:hypothetical protein E1287_02085 [Actinomadura sp. KC06]|uniref:hypothetical protein n=1 Tax=Actinomadura sp. KC06 TaxID=2530369 RepID=UPI001047147B|nr:hypothetical protein [Actinomadura sp. KC06]TDD39986.1 hypothetical protein E1287_02085 [Actinomadura sp. KC06]